MSSPYHRELLAQAVHLAGKERRRPKQASLRRAVSAAYYALFHFLIDEACRNIVGTTHQRRSLRHVLMRAFSHTTMKNASKTFSGGNLPAGLSTTLSTIVVSSELREVAGTFVTLQDERHRADYDLASPFSKSEVTTLIRSVQDAFELWETIKSDDASRLYLVALLSWDQLRGK
jgi:uncharacterized protein (UPF0332 family)